MQIQSNIQRRMRALARQIQPRLTETDLYLSHDMKCYFERLSLSICRDEFPENPEQRDVLIRYDAPNVTAATNGQRIILNPAAALVQYYDTAESRFEAFQGLFFHEMAHVVFLDFEAEDRAIRSIQNSGKLYGAAPKENLLTAQEKADWKELSELLEKNDQAVRLMVAVFHTISNVISDVHDENRMINRYGSWVGEGIYKLRSSQRYRSRNLEELLDAMHSGKLSSLDIAFELILQLARTGEVKCKDPSNLKSSRFAYLSERVCDHVELASETDNIRRRFEEINYIMLYLWPFIREQLQSETEKADQNAQSEQLSQSDSGETETNASLAESITEELVNKMLKELREAEEQSGMSTDRPANIKSSETAKKGRRQLHRSVQPEAEGMDEGKENRSLGELLEGVAQSMAEEAMEEEAAEALRKEITSLSQSSTHEGVPLTVERELRVSEADKARYEAFMNDSDNLKAISKKLQKELLEALRDQKEGFRQRHRLSGRELDFRDVYRPDGRCFTNKKAPEDIPDMAISVLVDNSGSMCALAESSGEKCESRLSTAKRAALLLYDFATGIGIPVSVAGHCTVGSLFSSGQEGVLYRVMADYEAISSNDCYRITKMEASGSNRDGMAIQIASELLVKRPERIKLLFILSDGLPNAENYSGEAAAEDIRRICRKARGKGVEVIAAAIGSDRENIKEIYGEECLDISDLSQLPKILTNIVKKRILRYAL